MQAPEREKLSRLRWRSRRGLLENDLLLERFYESYGDSLTDEEVDALYDLMALPDNDLLDLFLGRKAPTEGLTRPVVLALLQKIKPS
jgi:antitoxin CptB